MNGAYCNKCKKLVGASTLEENGRIFLVKDCPDCGQTRTLISADARRYFNKRKLDGNFPYIHCRVNCTSCRHKDPNMVFVDITNRCNMNCKICINNTPSMGFTFNPPLDYFRRLFEDLGKIRPRPVIQLFGGEPTVHENLFEIIAMARAQHLSVRLVTNGLKLADEEYCRRIIASRVTILIAYDGNNPALYQDLRNSKTAYDLKIKAIENIHRIGGAKLAMMSLVAKDYNDHDLKHYFEFCHEHPDVRGVYFMPLTHNWQEGKFEKEPELVTLEDVECRVAEVFAEDPVEFVPAGIFKFPNFVKYLRVRPLPFVGAHPNCESFYLLVSDGTQYVPLSRYLKHSIFDFCEDGLASDGRVGALRSRWKTSTTGRFLELIHLRRNMLYLFTLWTIFGLIRRHLRFDRLIKGDSFLGRVFHVARMMLGMPFMKDRAGLFKAHSRVHGALQLIVLPFETRANMETERLERCTAAFAWYDPVEGKTKRVPVCAWGLWKVEAMHKITDYYANAANSESAPEAPALEVAGRE